MRILYGVVGDGMGHATRSRVVVEHLLACGHRIRVLASDRAYRFLARTFEGRERVRTTEIDGLALTYVGNALRIGATIRHTLSSAPHMLPANLRVYHDLAKDDRPDVVISDFESFAWLFARMHRIPVVSIDNLQMLARCRHDPAVTDGLDLRMARMFVRARLPSAWHFLITTFFFPPVAKTRTTLVPPVLRPEIVSVRREPGTHVLVYQTAGAIEKLLPDLRRLSREFRVYGASREGREGNVLLRSFSVEGFVDDLCTARAVIAGGGFSLMGEAVHLGVPLLSVPLEGQMEQQLNARYLEKLGYGMRAEELDADTVAEFLDRIPACERALATYPRRDNGRLYHVVDEILERIARGDPPAEASFNGFDRTGALA